MDQHHKNTTDNYSLQDLGLKCSAWKRLCLNYPKLMQIIRNLAEIEGLPKCFRNKSSEIRNLFSAEIPPLLFLLPPQLPEPEGSKLLTFKFSSLNFVKSYSKLILLLYHHSPPPVIHSLVKTCPQNCFLSRVWAARNIFPGLQFIAFISYIDNNSDNIY